MSDTIQIKGIYGFGYHGVFDFEKINGQDFYVDLILTSDLLLPSKTDSLEDTIDYSAIVGIVSNSIEKKRFLLIEALAGDIANELLSNFSRLESVEVTVHKPSAPISATVEDISVTLKRHR